MIIKKITFRNILSYGNNDNVFEFGDGFNWQTIGIIGKNGRGKSSIMDTIFYALFDEPYRDIKKSSLINRENKGGLYVKIEFIANGCDYIIERGMSPKLIRITKNGKEENLDAHSKDIQKYIETQILGINSKLFGLLFMIGLGVFSSFFKTGIAERRAVFEFIVGINILSLMLKKVNKNNKELKEKIEKIKQKIEKHVEIRDMLRKQIEDIEKLKDNIGFDNEIKELNKKLDKNSKELAKINIKEFEEKSNNIEKEINRLEEARDKWKDELKSNKIIREQHKKIYEFFEKHDLCPTCEQSITPEYKKKKIEKLNKEIVTLDKTITTLDKKVNENNEKIENLENEDEKISTEESKYKTIKQEIDNINKDIKKFQEKNKKNDDDSEKLRKEIEEKIIEKKKEIKTLAKDGNDISQKLEMNEIFVKLLGDDGIKKYVYQILLKKVNSYVNDYVSEFNFDYKLQLDSELNETFYRRKGETVSYNSFSNGEKLVVDFSFIFGLLKFMEEFYGFKINILFFDEILDTSLDIDNKQFLLENLKKINKNIVIISHDYNLSSYFNECYLLEKEDGFSVVKKFS